MWILSRGFNGGQFFQRVWCNKFFTNKNSTLVRGVYVVVDIYSVTLNFYQITCSGNTIWKPTLSSAEATPRYNDSGFSWYGLTGPDPPRPFRSPRWEKGSHALPTARAGALALGWVGRGTWWDSPRTGLCLHFVTTTKTQSRGSILPGTPRGHHHQSDSGLSIGVAHVRGLRRICWRNARPASYYHLLRQNRRGKTDQKTPTSGGVRNVDISS